MSDRMPGTGLCKFGNAVRADGRCVCDKHIAERELKPLRHTLRALRAWRNVQPELARLERAHEDPSLSGDACQKAYDVWKERHDAEELKVRRAFFEDTKDRNSEENCLRYAGWDFIVKTALLSDGYDLVPAGEFTSFQDWVNHASSYIGFVKERAPARCRKLYKPLCFDAGDRLCTRGEHFQQARDQGRFPVKYYFKKERS